MITPQRQAFCAVCFSMYALHRYFGHCLINQAQLHFLDRMELLALLFFFTIANIGTPLPAVSHRDILHFPVPAREFKSLGHSPPCLTA